LETEETVVSRRSQAKTARELAVAFSALLLQHLGPEKMREVIRLNSLEKDPKVCHSHDFCDANEIMYEAQENLKLNLQVDEEESARVWSEAWGLAVRNKFFMQDRKSGPKAWRPN
jgi:hypothetical protein